MIHSKEKEAYFSQPREDIAGTAENPNGHIYRLCEDDMLVRHTEITSFKGGDPVEILQITDPHLNRMNKRDWAERNPAIISTRQFRMAFRNESTVGNLKKAMRLSPFFDQTVITGDSMDYLTWGSLDLMDECIWNDYPDTLVAVGGHDRARKMQGKVADTASPESISEILQSRWKHDIFYTSKVLADKVLLVVTVNNNKRYTKEVVDKLRADIERARENNWCILIFQHEPIASKNPNEKELLPIRENSPGNRDFCDFYLGSEGTDEITMEGYRLITENADIIKGLFCGHRHSEHYSEVMASYEKDGKRIPTVLPQYIAGSCMYDEGHIMIITVK